MSERLRASQGYTSPPERELSIDDLRRRLEGGLEVIEAARKRYATLEKRLRGVAWKRRLRRQSAFLQEVIDQEDTAGEAVARARKRAELEGWSAALPALEPLRDVVRRRARVEALLRGRLEGLAVPPGTAELKSDLALLRRLLHEPSSIALAPEETRILDPNRNAAMPLPVAALVFLLAPLIHLVAAVAGPRSVYFVLGMFVALMGFFIARAGECWLTSDRLVWKPVGRAPVSVSLRSIGLGGIQLDRLGRSVRVQGERVAHLRYVEPAEKLAALLEMHRQPPFLGASRGGLRLPDVSIYPATLSERRGGRARRGLAILRPQGVSFVPTGCGTAALRAITGAPLSQGLKIDEAWVLEELRWLSGMEFDEHLARVVEATGGVYWSSWEARRAPGVPVWKQIHLTRGPQSLVGKVDWSQQAPAERAFESWPSPEV